MSPAPIAITTRVERAAVPMKWLRITEIFLSLQGEARTVGCPTVFVRLTGCPLRCGYCDTAYAFTGGEVQSLDAITAAVIALGARYVTVTGGEPLAQTECRSLLTMLCDARLQVSLETSGALDISGIDPRVSVVMDLKTPDSGETQRNRWANIEHLQPNDQVKFVICSRGDYEWARYKIDEYQLVERVSDVLFSPVASGLVPGTLGDWIVADRLPVRFQLQLHKVLWGDVPGR